MLKWLEWCFPADAGVHSWLAQHDADAVIVSPLVDMNYVQLEALKAAQQLEIASIHLVASWDNLTMKGEVQIAADGVVLWNGFQADEAVHIHKIDRNAIHITGAQLYDQWFEMSASQDRPAFYDSVGGLDPDRPTLLYVASSPYICPDELSFFNDWYAELRRHNNPILKTCNVLIRPHPRHAAQWKDLVINAADVGQLAVCPRNGEMPLMDAQKQYYFDTLWHADALVGINTSAFLEAGIVGRKTFTFNNALFQSTQLGTMHFSYVANSGILQIAPDIAQHMDDLAQELSAPPRDDKGYVFPFIADFLRPKGIEKPATPLVVKAIETIASNQIKPKAKVRLPMLGRLIIWPFAALIIWPVYWMWRNKK